MVRPDYEGIGSAGPHPYLIGRSLATSVIDAATAARAIDPRIGQDVVVARHSGRRGGRIVRRGRTGETLG